ncbi:hypothetical protein [Actinoplanes sp. NPDC026623]|uniref:hypothetical protein n=1 Tax=Actinoplanes sp. NPDC026623 TaxID=3155610 RepID=UPI0033C8BD13
MGRVGIVSYAAVVGTLGFCLGGCGVLGDAASGDVTDRDCHPDPKSVAALSDEPVLTQAPPGATAAAPTETVSCGWAGSGSPSLGMLDREITRAGATDDVSRFYADLAGSSGWKTFGQGTNVYDASKPDGTHCTWSLHVVSGAEGTYHVQIEYTPRDLRPTCL